MGQGEVRHGAAVWVNKSRGGFGVRSGGVWRGKARIGAVWHGSIGRANRSLDALTGRGVVRLGSARSGPEGQGKVYSPSV